MTIPSGLTPAQTRSFLQRQVATGRYLILGTVIITVVDLVLLLTGADFYITYSLASAYYLVWLGKGFDNAFGYSWDVNGIYTRTGLLMAFILLTAFLVLWWLAKEDEKWIKISMIALAVDAVLLLLFAFVLLSSPLDCLFELVIHGAVIWEMSKALSSVKLLAQLPQEEAEEVTL